MIGACVLAPFIMTAVIVVFALLIGLVIVWMDR